MPASTSSSSSTPLTQLRSRTRVSYNPMSAQSHSPLPEHRFPPVPRADQPTILKQSLGFFLPSELCELLIQWVFGGDKRLLPMQNEWVLGVSIVAVLNLEAPKSHLERRAKGG